jgi:hypothetical protein
MQTAAPVDAGMTKQNVLDMVDAKVPQVTIISQIRASATTNFDLSTKGVIQLTKGGVAAPIIEAMRNPKAQAAISAPVSAPHPTTTALPPAKSSQTPAAAEPIPAPVAEPVTPPPVPVQSAPGAAPPAAPVRTNTVLTVPDGKPFNISLAQAVPVKLTAGQKINFTITNDVKVGDMVVIAKGTPVTGEVVDPGDPKRVIIVINKGRATFKLTNVESAGGTKLAIRATPAHSDKPDRPIELQGNKSKEVLAPAGAEYMGYIDNEQTVTIKH